MKSRTAFLFGLLIFISIATAKSSVWETDSDFFDFLRGFSQGFIGQDMKMIEQCKSTN